MEHKQETLTYATPSCMRTLISYAGSPAADHFPAAADELAEALPPAAAAEEEAALLLQCQVSHRLRKCFCHHSAARITDYTRSRQSCLDPCAHLTRDTSSEPNGNTYHVWEKIAALLLCVQGVHMSVHASVIMTDCHSTSAIILEQQAYPAAAEEEEEALAGDAAAIH